MKNTNFIVVKVLSTVCLVTGLSFDKFQFKLKTNKGWGFFKILNTIIMLFTFGLCVN